MKALFAVVAALGMLAGAPAQADVLKDKGCLNCHDMEKKKMGPAYKDVAAKYKGDAKAPAMLAAKLKDGKGHPKVQATDAEINAALKQVLAAK